MSRTELPSDEEILELWGEVVTVALEDYAKREQEPDPSEMLMFAAALTLYNDEEDWDGIIKREQWEEVKERAVYIMKTLGRVFMARAVNPN